MEPAEELQKHMMLVNKMILESKTNACPYGTGYSCKTSDLEGKFEKILPWKWNIVAFRETTKFTFEIDGP